MESAVDLTADEKKRPVYTLAELLEQCDENAVQADEWAAWDQIEPVGQEVW